MGMMMTVYSLSSEPRMPQGPSAPVRIMSTLGELVAFRALVNLAGEGTITRTTDLRKLAARFTLEELSAEIARLITPEGIKAKVDVVFQSVEDLHKACPNTTGDWYFTGNYPTPGGERVLRRSLENYLAHREGRSY